MNDKDAIREIKKIERIITKIEKAGYDVSLIDGNSLVLTSQFLANKRNERINNIGSHSMEGGLKEDEVIYCIQI